MRNIEGLSEKLIQEHFQYEFAGLNLYAENGVWNQEYNRIIYA